MPSPWNVLGVLLQNVWTTFNPQVIVLGGETVALGGEQFLAAAIGRLGLFARAAGLRPGGPGCQVRRTGHGGGRRRLFPAFPVAAVRT